MEKNRKIIKAGIILIGVTLSVCLLLVYICKIDNPVFLKHYYEYAIEISGEDTENKIGKTQLSLQYITNTTDYRYISYIIFEEEPDIMFYPNTNGMVFTVINNIPQNQGMTYGRYSVRSINLYADIWNINEDQEDIFLSKATIYFDNGDVIKTDIGEIYLYVNKPSEGCIASTSGSSSSDGSSSNMYAVKKDISLEKVESPLLNKVNLFLQMTIDENDYTDISGATYKEGDSFNVYSMYNGANDISSQFTNYEIRPILYYKDVEGNSYGERLYNVRSQQYYNYKVIDIFKYVMDRGGD